MKKEASEQTTVSGQTPLSLILDEIEERAKEVGLHTFYVSTALDVPALVKVVQHLRECIKAECSGVVAQACDMEAATILREGK